ncbi:MAG: hypothetical protein IJ285_00905 [Clostridia bacterium]|nr:hypothetical protein [Clostridia bacterium]
MARYIKDCDCAKIISEKFNIPLGDVIDVVYDISAADVVEVVRCEKCKYRNFNPESLQTKCMRRPYAPIYVEPNDFCSCGERNDI